MMVGAAVVPVCRDPPIPFAFQRPPDPLETSNTLAGMFAKRKTMWPSRQASRRHSESGA